MHVSLRHHPSFSVVVAEGAVTEQDMECLLDVFSLVPMEQALVVDLLAVSELDGGAARALRRELAARAVVAHVSIVVEDPGVAVALVLVDAHHSVSMVRSLDQAVELVTGVVLSGS